MFNLWNVILSSFSSVNKCLMQNKLDMADLASFSSKVLNLKWLKDSFKNLLTELQIKIPNINVSFNSLDLQTAGGSKWFTIINIYKKNVSTNKENCYTWEVTWWKIPITDNSQRFSLWKGQSDRKLRSWSSIYKTEAITLFFKSHRDKKQIRHLHDSCHVFC